MNQDNNIQYWHYYSFRSKDEEIELVTFDEFMREAPDSLTKKFEQVCYSLYFFTVSKVGT